MREHEFEIVLEVKEIVEIIVKLDFHVHTNYSPDSVITFESLVDACREKGIDAVAIMDHDEFCGAEEFFERADELRGKGEWAPEILKGEEIRTTGGEICGLFLKEKVPRKRSPLETMRMIKEQGGLVYVPHPFDLLKLKRLRARDLEMFAGDGLIDIIEAFNGKPRFPFANILASRFLRRYPFVRAAGSDAHEPVHLGAAYVELDEFNGPAELVENLREGTIRGKMYCPFYSAYLRLRIVRKDLSFH